LLASEVYEKLNKEGVYCDLITGQEQRYVPGATHLSCTVEAVNLEKTYDVAVVDEIQMIGDIERGHVWTRVLLGVRANELHVCGGLEAVEIVESLCKSTGDEFNLVTYDRLSKLE
jgi:ATP-dependent RNA helicase SUPV3L1/SUV3